VASVLSLFQSHDISTIEIKKEPKITYIIMTKTNKLGKHLNNEKITQGEGRTRASTDASLLSMLMPNSFAYGLFS
jgi:hypothetical protein